MTARHPTQGGKQRRIKQERPPKPRNAPALVPCSNCSRRNLVTLLPGNNDVSIACECGSVTTISVQHDGSGNAIILRGTIEKVEP
jgi:hypothetical protein